MSATKLICAVAMLLCLVTGSAFAADSMATEVIRKGETLATFSFRIYGTHQLWPEIHLANRDLLSDPNHVYAGVRLRVPRSSEIETKIDRILRQRKVKAEIRTKKAFSQGLVLAPVPTGSVVRKLASVRDSQVLAAAPLETQEWVVPKATEDRKVERPSQLPDKPKEAVGPRTLAPYLEMELPWSR